MAKFKYFGTAVAVQSLNHEEIKSTLNSGVALYGSAQNLLSSCLLFKEVKIRIRDIIILPVVFYYFGTWSLTSREECGCLKKYAEKNIWNQEL